jgi:hypothetical protein
MCRIMPPSQSRYLRLIRLHHQIIRPVIFVAHSLGGKCFLLRSVTKISNTSALGIIVKAVRVPTCQSFDMVMVN